MKLIAPSAPNLPLATADYEQAYQTSLTNVLRLYFNQISNTLQAVVGNEGGQYLSFPYGAFYDTTTQTAVAANTPYAVTFNSTTSTNSVRVPPTDSSMVVVDEPGLYNFAFSLQVTKSTASSGYVFIWVRVNGVDVANSATKVHLSGSNAAMVAAWNFFLDLQAGDTFQLMWAADNTATTILYEPATGFCPAIPSAILTVNFISVPPTNTSA